MRKTIFILSFALFLPVILLARTGSLNRDWYKNWYVGTTGGVNIFTTEIKKDFSRVSMDMNPKPNGVFSFHIDKIFNNNFGVGIEFEKNFFAGDKTFPNKINWLVYGSRFNNENSTFISHPVYFRTNTSTWFVNFHYNFMNFKNKNNEYLDYNLYVKAGLGFTSIGVELGYKDPAYYNNTYLPNPLYEKGQGIHSFKDMYGSFHIGTGLNYFLSSRFSLNAELSFLFVSNDYLDGIHNYEATIMPNNQVVLNRQEAYAFIPEFKIGISYHFNWFKRKLNESIWGQSYEEFRNKFYHSKKKTNKNEQPVIDEL